MSETVLDDAADSHIGHGEGLGEQLDAPRLNDGLLINGALEVDYAAVGVNSARLYVPHIFGCLVEDNLDVGELAPFFREDLDARVTVLGRSVVISVDLLVQQYSRGAGRMRLAAHLQLFRRNRQPIPGANRRRAGAKGQCDETRGRYAVECRHELPCILLSSLITSLSLTFMTAAESFQYGGRLRGRRDHGEGTIPPWTTRPWNKSK